MRIFGTATILRAAAVVALCAAGCGGGGGKGDSDPETDGGVGGGGAGGQVTGGQANGGQATGGQANGGEATGGQGTGGQANGGEAPPPGAALGAECELPPRCQNDGTDPEICCSGAQDDNELCSTGGCATGRCETRFSELRGYCTRDCERDSACEGFEDGPFGSAFRCIHDNTSGQCNPGSNDRCDGPANGACETAGEVCTFAQTYQTDAYYGGLCQPGRAGGAATGEPCDEDAGDYCANGMCLAGKCTTFCDPAAETSVCAGGLVCFNDFSFADGQLLLDICAPAYCEKNADCGADEVCGITLDFGGNPFIVGICVPKDVSQPGVGDACPAGTDFCDGGNLCVGDNGEYCSGFCDTDADCPNGACTVISLLLDQETMQTAPMQLCVPAAPGSGRSCQSDTDCAAADGQPDEACEPIVRGAITAGRPSGALSVEGRCVAKPAHSVAAGEACSDAAPCQVESLCDSGFCGSMCRTTADCGATGFCQNALVSDGGTQALSDNVYTGICSADAGSHTACEKDADCAEAGEFCRFNVLLTGAMSSVEKFCSAKTGDAAAGTECHADRDCMSDRCAAWSKRAADAGYCFGICETDADCSPDGSITCEETAVYQGDEGVADDVHAKTCTPAHTCATCDFGGAHPCGGDTVCSLVSYNNDRRGGACLPACGDGGACPDGFTCQAVVDAAGAPVAGQTACTPVTPDESCLAARPLR